jgi:DNA processing protein
MKDLLYKIALTKIPLVGAVTAKNLVSYCGGVREVFEARKNELLKIPGIGSRLATNILNKTALEEAEKELLFLEQNEITALFYLDKNFPQRLRQLYDAPVLLYYRGTAPLSPRRVVAIVGTRTPTPRGTGICEDLVEGLAPFSPLIISGLAYGIDVTAHKASLRKGLETVAVLGHGLSQIYPAQHRKVALEMVQRGGLLTELTHEAGPDREHFPMRNRIVAGLCDALIVVESAAKGGSIITVQQANSYNREVFAVPGRTTDKFSQGCNFLIKNSLARLVESARDVARMMRWKEVDGPEKKAFQAELFPNLTDREKQLLDLIQKEEEIGVDQIGYQTKIANSELAATLLNLEFKGLVRSLPGKRYVLS